VKTMADACTKCGVCLTDDNRVSYGRTGKSRRQCRTCYDARPSSTPENHRRYRVEARDAVHAAYGNRCACCGEARREFLAVDHVNGGGNKHRREIGKCAINLHRLIIKKGFPNTYRLLCHNCNQARGAYGYCPHEREKSECATMKAA
jgi:hypothetical protein